MKILYKIKPIEVKRCFVISDFISQKYSQKQSFSSQVTKAKKVILELPEIMLDRLIRGTFPKRYKMYNKMDWYLAEVTTSEVGVWKRAGDLKKSWTYGSLEETGKLVKEALRTKSKHLPLRAGTVIPGILKNSVSFLQKEKYLLPVILPGGSMGRKGLKKMKGDIDDGCMRSIALAVSGKKKIKAYFGKKRK